MAETESTDWMITLWPSLLRSAAKRADQVAAPERALFLLLLPWRMDEPELCAQRPKAVTYVALIDRKDFTSYT